jgi:hypothetical protein
MLSFLSGIVRPWHIFTGILIVAALDLSILLITGPRLLEYSGGTLPFDARLMGYSLKESEAYHTALGGEGRNYYRMVFIPADSLLAIIEGITLAIILLWFTRHDGRYSLPSGLYARSALLALVMAATAADLRENWLTHSILAVELPLPQTLVASASLATQVKALLLGAALVVTAGIAVLAWRRGR